MEAVKAHAATRPDAGKDLAAYMEWLKVHMMLCVEATKEARF